LQESGQLDVLELAEAELENHRKRYVEQPIRGVFEVLGNPEESSKDGVAKYAVILGDPGSGKSTLLQYLALIWAERPVRDLPLYPLPLLLELRTYARDKQAGKCKDIVSFIHGGNITCRLNQQDLHEKLKSGDVIALFDGIDEVFDPALRDEVVTDIHRFTNDYPKVRSIATSRWLGYKSHRLINAGFQHFMLQELNDEQMQDFVVRWHDLNFVEGVDKDRKQERLQKAIRESRSIKELAGNPLLLTMMAILNRNQELPRDRPELYNQASRVLLHQWDVERALVEDRRIDPKTIDYRDKQAMLRKVAYYMQSSAKGLAGNLISAAQLESILTDYLKTIEVEKPREIARIMIGQLRTRNFILCDLGGDSYGFVHRTFLEYFCAWEFVWQFKEEQTLTIEQLINDVFGQHWRDESWHEVLRLISGMIEPRFVAEIIEFLLSQNLDRSKFLENDDKELKSEGLSNLLLASDCLSEVRNTNLIISTSNNLLDILKKEATEDKTYGFTYEAAISLLTRITYTWQSDLQTLGWLKNLHKSSPFWHIQYVSIFMISQGWKDDPETLPWLKDYALNYQNYAVRSAAVQEIAKGWKKDDSDTLPLLKDRALNDQNYVVRSAAVQEIAKGWKDDSDTLPWLKDRALNDQNYNVRSAAVQEIAKGWKDDSDTLPLLKDRALNDQNYNVRSAAVQEIAKGWKDDSDTLPWLKDRALNDHNYNVQSAAVQEIAKGWKDDSDTLPWLKDCVLNDQDNDVRSAAVQEIAKGWKDGSDTLPLLKDRALNDQNWDVRRAAVQEIAKGWKDDSDTLPLLKDRVLNDQDNDVRSAAVQEIAKGWKDDSSFAKRPRS
jgi:energy-coupling factor transporter ATP-binding protein EcfA2